MSKVIENMRPSPRCPATTAESGTQSKTIAIAMSFDYPDQPRPRPAAKLCLEVSKYGRGRTIRRSGTWLMSTENEAFEEVKLTLLAKARQWASGPGEQLTVVRH